MREHFPQSPHAHLPNAEDRRDSVESEASAREMCSGAVRQLEARESGYRDSIRVIGSLAGRIKSNPALRYVQLLATVFSLSTSVAQRAAAYEMPAQAQLDTSETAEQKKFEQARAVFQAELAHLKSLGYRLVPARQPFSFKEDDKADIERKFIYLAENFDDFRQKQKQNVSSRTYTNSVDIVMFRLAADYEHLASMDYSQYKSPFDYMQEQDPGLGDVSPDLWGSSREVQVPVLSFSSRILEGGNVRLVVRNWLTSDLEEAKDFPNEIEAAEYLQRKCLRELEMAGSHIDMIPKARKEDVGFALRPDMERMLTPAQQDHVAQLFEKVRQIRVEYSPEGRTGSVEIYDGNSRTPNIAKMTITRLEFENAHGHPLLLNRRIQRIIVELKPELANVATGIMEQSYEIDADGNLVAHIRTKQTEALSIQPRFAYCEEMECAGQVPLNLDLRKIGLPHIRGIFMQELKQPIGYLVSGSSLKLFSGYSREIVDANIAPRKAEELAKGISTVESYFGISPGTLIKDVYFSDVHDNASFSNAGIDPQTPEMIDIGDLRDKDYVEGMARHESGHSVDMRLKISDDSRFVALFEKIAQEQPALFALFAESNFFREDGATEEYGHPYGNPSELLASVLNGLHSSRWEQKVGEFSPEQREIYRDVLSTIETILREKAAAGSLSPDAPILEDLRVKRVQIR